MKSLKKVAMASAFFCGIVCLAGCGSDQESSNNYNATETVTNSDETRDQQVVGKWVRESRIGQSINYYYYQFNNDGSFDGQYGSSIGSGTWEPYPIIEDLKNRNAVCFTNNGTISFKFPDGTVEPFFEYSFYNGNMDGSFVSSNQTARFKPASSVNF